jgi:hypothetical protein
MTLRMEEFAWQAVREESSRLGVAEEDLIGFAVLYYLADVDSGRIARRPLVDRALTPRPTAGEAHRR